MLYIALIILSSILVLILIITIVWRIFKKDSNDIYKRTFVASKKTIESYEFFAKINDVKMFVNILIKNKYSKSNNSLLPGIIITNKKIYILSEIIYSNDDEKIIVDNSKYKNLKLEKVNKKIQNIENVSFIWIKEVKKYFKNKNVDFEIILISNNDKSLIENNTNIRVITLDKLLSEIEIDNQSALDLIDSKKWIDFFKKNNYLGSK